MSSTAPAAAVHRVYRKVTAKNAKCDICNTRNLGVMQKCVTCGVTTCENCKATGRYDSKHNLTGLDLDWAKPNTNGKGVRASVRDNKTILLVNSSDDDDGGLLVPQTPRAPRAPGTSSREGLIREPATMTAACNLQRAREDQANQRQSGLGDGPDFHFTTQPQDQGYSSAHDLVGPILFYVLACPVPFIRYILQSPGRDICISHAHVMAIPADHSVATEAWSHRHWRR